MRARPTAREPGVTGWLAYYRNPITCFVVFALFLISLPVLGMLIGGVGFVFVLMGMLGGWAPRQLAVHAVVALATVGLTAQGGGYTGPGTYAFNLAAAESFSMDVRFRFEIVDNQVQPPPARSITYRLNVTLAAGRSF